VLTVTDTGVGIADADRSRVFEPFFTTKRMAPGMGLTTAYGVVARCGGHIALEGEPGRGTTVVCSFPLAAPSRAVLARGKAPEIGAGQTVLVAEDEPMVRLIVAGTLRDLGFDVLEAGDGAEALTTAEEAPPALLVTDVVMPRMGGRELAARLRERSPGLRVLFVSGFTDGALGNADDPETSFLPKPFMSTELADAVRSLLEPEPAA
jgi:two-component system cell cycle sensor histidine kinase/response regulator CckA